MNDSQEVEDYELRDDLVYFGDKLYVPKDYALHTQLLEQVHIEKSGHMGIDWKKNKLAQLLA